MKQRRIVKVRVQYIIVGSEKGFYEKDSHMCKSNSDVDVQKGFLPKKRIRRTTNSLILCNTCILKELVVVRDKTKSDSR